MRLEVAHIGVVDPTPNGRESVTACQASTEFARVRAGVHKIALDDLQFLP
jgi:hypothetical protein